MKDVGFVDRLLADPPAPHLSRGYTDPVVSLSVTSGRPSRRHFRSLRTDSGTLPTRSHAMVGREGIAMIQTLVCAGFLVAVISLGTSSVAVGQTQTEMNEEAGTRLRTAEAELKKVIEELESKARGKSKALEALRNGQVAWENYRDAQLRALWPFPESTSYGSVHPMCVADTKAEMTRVRTRELRAMMKPTEGDACSSQWPD